MISDLSLSEGQFELCDAGVPDCIEGSPGDGCELNAHFWPMPIAVIPADAVGVVVGQANVYDARYRFSKELARGLPAIGLACHPPQYAVASGGACDQQDSVTRGPSTLYRPTA